MVSLKGDLGDRVGSSLEVGADGFTPIDPDTEPRATMKELMGVRSKVPWRSGCSR